MQTARELFIHELTDLLDAEQKLVKALGDQEKDSKIPELKKAFGDHKRQTEGQVKRLRQVFKTIDEEPEDAECKGIKGIIEERESFKEEDPAQDLLAVFDVGAAIKVETYEICAYNSVISMAELLGFDDAVELLQQNLNEEEETLERMQDLQDEIEPEELGIDEEEEGEEELSADLEDEEIDEEDEEPVRASSKSKKSSSSKSPKKGKSKRVA